MSNMNVLILLILFVNFSNAAIQLDSSCLKRPQACDDDAFSVADFLICGGNAYGPEVPGAKSGSGQRGSGCAFNFLCSEVFPTDELDTGATRWGSDAEATCLSSKIGLLGVGYDTTLNTKSWSVRKTNTDTWATGASTGDVAEWIASGKMGTAPNDVSFSEQWYIKEDGADDSTATTIGMNSDLMNNEKVILAKKKYACKKWMTAGTAVCTPAAWFPWTIVGVGLLLIGGIAFYFFKKKNKQYTGKSSKKGGSSKYMGYHRRNARVFDDGI